MRDILGEVFAMLDRHNVAGMRCPFNEELLCSHLRNVQRLTSLVIELQESNILQIDMWVKMCYG